MTRTVAKRWPPNAGLTVGLAALAFTAAAVAFAAPPDQGPEKTDWAEARSLRLRGRYAEAIEQFHPAARHSPGAAIGLARCYLATGRIDDTRQTLTLAAEQHEKPAEVRAELALLALETGDHAKAAKYSQAALALDNNSLPARWVAAELLRQSGQLDKAEAAYGWFIDRQRELTIAGEPLDAESLHWIGQAAAQSARWTRNHRLFHSLVNDLYPAALKQEPDFWPAHLQIALLFQEKFNAADAADALAAALAINPHAAELHAARAAWAVRAFDVGTAATSLERALEINPRLVWAHQLQCDVQMIAAEPARAIEHLNEALELRPHDEETLGRLLACYVALEGGTVEQPSPRMAAVIEQAGRRNPHCGELFLAAGDGLDRMRRFGQAAGFYREAHRRMPQLLATHSQLGMTLMRLGEEIEAAQVLEEAFRADPYHVRVKNTLEVLDLLQSYAVIETDHFVIKFDRGQTELLARYAAEHLENEVYPQLTQSLGYTPEGKTLFEILSRAKNTSGHGWFSARMAGVPAVGTVGACAGKMVAITAPDELPSKYNWAKVLRHEFVHVLNLQQTDFNVPHWLTEGIAVHLENEPRPEAWNKLLVRRAKENTLFTLDNILFGFVRPQQRDDWTLAYCQAELYVDYARQTHGDDAIAKLLAAFGERKSTSEAIRTALGVSQEAFERGYAKFVEKLVADVAVGAPTASQSLDELLAQAEADPKDTDSAAAVAEAYLRRDDKPAARRWADAALKLQADQPAANYVLARLELTIGGTDEADDRLEKAAAATPPHEEALALLAAIKLKHEDFAAAEKWYTLGQQTFPNSDRWAKGLVRIYLQNGEDEKLEPVLVQLAEHDPGSLPLRKKLAQLALKREAFKDARRWATQALHLDVADAETHALLAEAAAGGNNFALAAEEYGVAVELAPDRSAWRFAWGAALLKGGKKDEARRVLLELQQQEPGFAGLSKLLESIQP